VEENKTDGRGVDDRRVTWDPTEQQPPGRLRIFFGYSPGVGKTHAMLDAAEAAKQSGKRVLVGHAELHPQPETKSQDHPLCGHFDPGITSARQPDLVLLDDLAHTNEARSRNRKRWQDVEELRRAGIDVWTTLNVQDIESLNEAVAQITGVPSHGTVPDRWFDEATEITFVDLSPDELLQRVREGKVHVPERMARDAEQIFRMPNLVALRELALRCVTDRARGEHRPPDPRASGRQTWSATERVLVYVESGFDGTKLIRSAQRMTSAMRAEWVVVYPETRFRKQDARKAELLNRNLRLSEQLGAETVKLTGDDVVLEILKYAASRNVTRIVVGKEARDGRLRFWHRSPAERLISQSGDIDIYVIRNARESDPTSSTSRRRRDRLLGYIEVLGFVAMATGIGAMFDSLGLSDATLVMTYLLAVVLSAVRLGRGPALLASLAGVLLFNFFFTTPRLTFVVDNPEQIYTFSVMLVIALIVSALTAKIREQIDLSREKERRTEVLYRVSHRLAGIPGELQLVRAAQEELVSIFSGEIAFFLARDGNLRIASRPIPGPTDWPNTYDAAKWAYEHRQMAGWGTDAIPDAQALYLPLATPNAIMGVLAWRPEDTGQLVSFERRQLLKVIAAQIALALERDRLAQETQAILAQVDAEKIRSSLLSAVSHDLRTPLTSISGAASTLLEQELNPTTQRELAEGIAAEADRLNRLLENLLQLTRLESGGLRLRREWQALDETIRSVVAREERALTDRPVQVCLPEEPLWVPIDEVLIEQVLQNLVDNAAKYSNEGMPIEITARSVAGGVQVAVSDRGIGIDPDECDRVFDKFYRGRGRAGSGSRGTGLGLAISRGIVLAHEGRIWAEPRPGGGAVFQFFLPAPEGIPPIEDEPAAPKEGRGYAA